MPIFGGVIWVPYLRRQAVDFKNGRVLTSTVSLSAPKRLVPLVAMASLRLRLAVDLYFVFSSVRGQKERFCPELKPSSRPMYRLHFVWSVACHFCCCYCNGGFVVVVIVMLLLFPIIGSFSSVILLTFDDSWRQLLFRYSHKTVTSLTSPSLHRAQLW